MKQTLHTGKFLRLIQEGHWEYVDRVNATGAAIIVAVTNEDKLLVVEQYRVPVHVRTVELPAGIIGDDPGNGAETHEAAAGRELLEETGYKAACIEAMCKGPASSGVTSEVVTVFRALDLVKVHAGGGVEHEDITVHEVPLSEVDAWLQKKAAAGVLVDPKIYAGLYFIRKVS